MNTSVVAHCSGCRAVVNVTWKACPSCLAPIRAHSYSTALGVPAPGDRITWQGPDGKQRGPATVDFLHPDDPAWACVTLTDGTWGWVKLKYVTRGLEG